MLTDLYAHKFYDDPKAGEEVEDEEFNLEAELEKLEQNPDEWEPLN